MAFAWHLSQTLPRRICQKLTHLRKLVFHVFLYSKLALALALALVLLDSEDGLKILAGGEWGLFPVTPAIAWPLRPPVCQSTSSSKKCFVHSFRKLDVHSVFWLNIQPVFDDRARVSTHSVLRVDANNDHQSFSECHSNARHFLPKPPTILSSCNILILLRIFKFTIFRSTFFASAIFMPNFSENIFSSIPQWFQQVTKIFARERILAQAMH